MHAVVVTMKGMPAGFESIHRMVQHVLLQAGTNTRVAVSCAMSCHAVPRCGLCCACCGLVSIGTHNYATSVDIPCQHLLLVCIHMIAKDLEMAPHATLLHRPTSFQTTWQLCNHEQLPITSMK